MVRKNVIEMYSTHNEGKTVVAERLIRTFNTGFQHQKMFELINYMK